MSLLMGNKNKSAAELVAAAEINASLKQQIQETESLNVQRQTKIDECVVLDASLHSRAAQLRRKNITLDPLRHQVEKLTIEVRRLEKELNDINDLLEVPERKVKLLEMKQREAEESYVDRFELRPHKLSESVVTNILGGVSRKDYAEEQARSKRHNPLHMTQEDVDEALKKKVDEGDIELTKHRYDDSYFAEVSRQNRQRETDRIQEEKDKNVESLARDRNRNEKELSLSRIRGQQWFSGDGHVGGGTKQNFVLEQDFEGSLIPVSIRRDIPNSKLLPSSADKKKNNNGNVHDTVPFISEDLEARIIKRRYEREDIPVKPSDVSLMLMMEPKRTGFHNHRNNEGLALLPVDDVVDEDKNNRFLTSGTMHVKNHLNLQQQQTYSPQPPLSSSSSPFVFDAEKWMLKHMRDVEATCPRDASIARQSSVHEGVNRRNRTRFVRDRMREEIMVERKF